ncbi:MAG: hypothetical protein JOZ96_09590 [Acidobacteria bacterium]|nr:hypothetical protein [Acidobacteriota bacterium]
MNIRAVGDAILDDFFTVTGSDIPPDVVLEFTTAAGVRQLPADFARPHLAYVESLSSLPAGDATLRLTSQSANAASNVVPVTVRAGPPPQAARLLHAGEDKPHPYTIAIVANPLIASHPQGVAAFRPDPILTAAPRFRRAVTRCLKGLFAGAEDALVAEDVLRRDNIDARMRLVTVFRTPLPGGPSTPLREANSLIEQAPDNARAGLRLEQLAGFLAKFPTGAGETKADVVIVLNNSETLNGSFSIPTQDDAERGGESYSFDDKERKHCHFASAPGCSSLHIRNVDLDSPTVIHEFCHAASELNNGWIMDTSINMQPGTRFAVNQKHRADAKDAVPPDFATYNGTTFRSNPVRFDGTPYPTHWTAYHPEPLDGRQRSLMDDWQGKPDRLRCRLDRLTYTWLRDRLNVKLSRQG